MVVILCSVLYILSEREGSSVCEILKYADVLSAIANLPNAMIILFHSTLLYYKMMLLACLMYVLGIY